MNNIIKRFICALKGHDRLQHKDFYGFLTNGEPTYVLRHDKCSRCGK